MPAFGSLVAIVSLLTASRVSSLHLHGGAAQCSGINPAVKVTEQQSSSETFTSRDSTPLVNCNDVDLTDTDSDTRTIQSVTCFIPAEEAANGASDVRDTPAASSAVTAPSVSSPGSLCNGLGSSHTVHALNDGCQCLRIWRLTDSPPDCEATLDGCVWQGMGGFNVFEDYSAYTVDILDEDAHEMTHRIRGTVL
ncbi:hypothetical protein C8Q80DRAFT_1266953 [Daedaleopsis nitida]|nr:hypothetical protein C8Q80DRAFT_1266953 [Daedaleopsis nitida]